MWHFLFLEHCSPESNLVKNWMPEEPTIDSESSSHKDFKNDMEIVTSRLTKYKSSDFFSLNISSIFMV